LAPEHRSTTLVLSGTIPGEPGVGGVILADLVAGMPFDTLQFVPLVSKQVVQHGWLDRSCQLAGHLIRRYEPGFKPVKGLVGELISWTARKTLFERHCRQLVSKICHMPIAQGCDKVFAILDCPTVMQVATAVAQRLQKPLVVMVWDAPELLADQLNMDRWSTANMLQQFAATIQQAEKVGVICEQMKQAYTKTYGENEYVILRHGISPKMWSLATGASNSDRITIGFAGSITAQEPFRRLIETLDANNWRLCGKSVTLRLIGCRYTLDSRRPQHIEYFGWRSLKETLRLLAESDLLYLPQPFESHLRPLAELSFPTKLSSYLAAGRRVLLHAPEYASIAPFLLDYPIGVHCLSLETDVILSSLEQLMTMADSTVTNAIDAARRDEFNDEVFHARFRELVSFKPNDFPNSSAAFATTV
jgi:hypothetical protein